MGNTQNAAERCRSACNRAVLRGDSIWRLTLLGVRYTTVVSLIDSDFHIKLLVDLLKLSWSDVHSIPGLSEQEHEAIHDALLGYERMDGILAAIKDGIADGASAYDLVLLGAPEKALNLLADNMGIQTLEDIFDANPTEMVNVKHVGAKSLEQIFQALASYPELPRILAERSDYVRQEVKRTDYELCPERACLRELQNSRA